MRGPAALIFFHPDYTVGPGVPPGQRTPKAPGRGLYRQWGLAPRPEDKGFSCVLRVLYDVSGKNATPILGILPLGAENPPARADAGGEDPRRGNTPGPSAYVRTGFVGAGPRREKVPSTKQMPLRHLFFFSKWRQE